MNETKIKSFKPNKYGKFSIISDINSTCQTLTVLFSRKFKEFFGYPLVSDTIFTLDLSIPTS